MANEKQQKLQELLRKQKQQRQGQSWKVEMWPLDRIRPYDQNPRRNDAAVDNVAESIREFGFRQPIVVDTAGVIVAGHTRWKAAQALQLSQVPVHVAEELSPEEIRAYRIRDNRSHEIADWAQELLVQELAELKDEGLLDGAGFTEEELQALLEEAGGYAPVTDPEIAGVEYDAEDIKRAEGELVRSVVGEKTSPDAGMVFAICPECGKEFEVQAS